MNNNQQNNQQSQMNNNQQFQQNNQSLNKEKKQRQGRELFYGVIAISIFIVLAVGATFAYFTATTRSGNTAVTTSSTTLQLEYISYSTAWARQDLIPASSNVAEYSVEYQNDTTMQTDSDGTETNSLCLDDYGNSVCSAYEFQIKNNSNSPLTISLSLVSTVNGFSNLNAMAYQVSIPDADTDDYTSYTSTENNNGTNDPIFKANSSDATDNAVTVEDNNNNPLYTDSTSLSPVYLNRAGVQKTLLSYSEDGTTGPSINRAIPYTSDSSSDETERTTLLASDVSINGGETITFAIILYIKNLDEDQTEDDAEKSFTGQVLITSGDGSGVSGTISGLTGNESTLQSGGE